MKLLKLAAISSVALLAVSAEAKQREGAYAGAALGYSNLNTKAEVNVTGVGQGKKTTSNSGFEGDLILGYDTTFSGSMFVLGTEIFGGFNTTETKSKSITYAGLTGGGKSTLQGQVGVSINPGYDVSQDIALYLKLGAVYGWFNDKVWAHGVDQINQSNKKQVWGFVPGARLNWALNHCWATHLDLNYTMYQSRKFNLATTAGVDVGQAKFSSNIFSALVGVTYKF